MSRSILYSAIVAGFALAAPAVASDLENAPPSFGYRNATVVPIDIQTVDIDYNFNYRTKKATATAVVEFVSGDPGYPMLDLVPSVSSVKLDGATVDTNDFPVVSDPDRVTSFRVLKRSVDANSQHTLELTYTLDSDDVSFSNGSVRAGFFMSDLTTGGRRFFEQYGPANYEFDHIKYTFNVTVTGASRDHEVFTNADVIEEGASTWRLEFPDYFTTSSVYFHISEKNRFNVSRFTYSGVEQEIPAVVYSSSSNLTSSGVSRSKRVMSELERTYGAYTHNKIVVYVTSGGGGMEYGGATMTSMGALGHEFTHFWFARGVMPSQGNSGWIDEAIASWRDDGYPRARSAPNRSSVNLGGFSPYRRHTTREAYSRGATLISEFDYMFRTMGGMRTVLKEMFADKKMKTITVGYFKDFLESTTGQDLTRIFDRYVFGKSEKFDTPEPEKYVNVIKNGHPRPYTKDELKKYR